MPASSKRVLPIVLAIIIIFFAILYFAARTSGYESIDGWFQSTVNMLIIVIVVALFLSVIFRRR